MRIFSTICCAYILISLCACSTVVTSNSSHEGLNKSGLVPTNGTYRIPLPIGKSTIVFPSGGLQVHAADPEIPWYMLADDKTGLNVSFNFEATGECHNSRDCRDYFAQKLKKLFPYRTELSDFNIDEVYISEAIDMRTLFESMSSRPEGYDEILKDKEKAAHAQEIIMRQKHMNAHYVRDNVWIDMHLSKVFYEEKDRELFLNFIRSVKIESPVYRFSCDGASIGNEVYNATGLIVGCEDTKSVMVAYDSALHYSVGLPCYKWVFDYEPFHLKGKSGRLQFDVQVYLGGDETPEQHLQFLRTSAATKDEKAEIITFQNESMLKSEIDLEKVNPSSIGAKQLHLYAVRKAGKTLYKLHLQLDIPPEKAATAKADEDYFIAAVAKGFKIDQIVEKH
jgi:hypothetical protein